MKPIEAFLHICRKDDDISRCNYVSRINSILASKLGYLVEMGAVETSTMEPRAWEPCVSKRRFSGRFATTPRAAGASHTRAGRRDQCSVRPAFPAPAQK